MTQDDSFSASHLSRPATNKNRGPIEWLLDFFSGFRLCVVLLTLLFVYCTIGSAGMFVPDGWNVFSPSTWSYQQIRQWPVFEMTEFEWFHTWVFYALNGLLVVNMVVATLRRIPFKPVSYGSWMIHSGIVVLIAGCVVYFSTKIEGDAPVWRRQVVITVPGGHSATLPAIKGKRLNIQGEDGAYAFQVADVEPALPLPAGGSVYSVSVRVTNPRGDTFIRRLADGLPQHTEDVLPGVGRVRNIPIYGGAALLDPSVSLSLAYDAQDRFWIKDSSAIYLREGAKGQWSERPTPGMPRYNAHLRSLDEVFPDNADRTMVRPLDAPAFRANDDDALQDISARVTGYVPYADLQTRYTPDPNAGLNPVLNLELFDGASTEPNRFQLAAFDPEHAELPGGGLRFEWVDNPRLVEALDVGHAAILTIAVPDDAVEIEVPFATTEMGDREAEFVQIEGTDFAYRVTSILPRFPIAGKNVSLCIVEFQTPEGLFARWVASDPSITRDLAENAHMPAPGEERTLDERFVTTFDAVTMSTVTVVAGPPDLVTPRVLVLNPSGSGTFSASVLPVGGEPRMILPGQGISARIADLYERAERKTLPRIIPESARDREIARGRFAALAQVELRVGDATYTQWVPYHQYAFDRDLYYGGAMGEFSPAVFRLADGRTIQAIFSREQQTLPNPVALSDFHIDERVGGYTQQAGAQSIMNWTSELKFMQSDATWTDNRAVSANNPKAFGGLWFFQASWDPPREPSQFQPEGSAGLNHTGLGIGNRKGVWTMLFGSCISVLGMIYAFYVKPVIKRRQRDAVHAGLGRSPAIEENTAPAHTSTSRLAVAGWFAVGVLIASGAASLALKASLRSATADPSTFAGQVDLTPLDRSAVYSRGRVKSFDSLANEIMGFIAGGNRIDDQPTDFTYLDLMLFPERYADEPLIYVKKKQIRERLINSTEQMVSAMAAGEAEAFRERLDRFMESGLVSPAFFEHEPVRAQMQEMRRDVVKTANFVTQIENALAMRTPEVLGDILRVVPPPSGSTQDMWLSPIDIFGGVSGHRTESSVLANAMPAGRRDALRESFQKLGDTWFRTRQLELRESPSNLTELGIRSWNDFERALLRYLDGLPPSAATVRDAGASAFAGIASLDERTRLERMDAFADALLGSDSELAWAEDVSPYFALMHIAELACSDELLPSRISIGAQRTSDEIAAFAAMLPADESLAERGLYPEKSRLLLESWYFKVGGATWIWIVYLLSLLMLLMAVVYKWSGARAVGMGLFTSAFLMHTLVLGWRWYASGRWPNSNMFEAVTTSVWLGTLCVIAIEVFARRTPLRNLFALTAAGASMVAMMSAHFVPQLDANINNMMPILHDMWLYIHTNMIIASYALIAMASVTSLLYLAWRALGNSPDHATVGGADMLLRTNPGQTGLKRAISAGAVFDGATMILIELSFVMLWAGLVMGAIWADHSWGRPWGWDPKEVFALNTFFVYLVLIHIRLSSKDKGLWTALLSLVGCGVMLFNWIVINFVISGLHSYA